MQDAASIDFSVLEEIRVQMPDGGAAFADQILEVFERAGGRDLRTLQEVIDAGDLKQTAFVSHRLKGSSASVGAFLFSSHLREINRAAAAGDLDRVRALGEAVGPMMSSALSALRQWAAEVAVAAACAGI